MAISATLFGALLGVGTQMYSNALRKLPYMRHPWEHVLGMGLGALFVNQLIKFDAKAQDDLDKLLIKAKQANERRYFGILLLTFSLLYPIILDAVMHIKYMNSCSLPFLSS
ncbi:excitatory amino acid transporter [Perilla frutescens var. hirtella]|nr:excitatory amino acid transporter [Perilla frutescens var. frutescens]KAH6776197.1 excitatory amino acid transporter [Perilla frutescens var. hirtella]